MKRVKNRRILLIISSFFPNSNVGRGPWSERFNGLYLKLIKKPMALAGVFIYMNPLFGLYFLMGTINGHLNGDW